MKSLPALSGTPLHHLEGRALLLLKPGGCFNRQEAGVFKIEMSASSLGRAV